MFSISISISTSVRGCVGRGIAAVVRGLLTFPEVRAVLAQEVTLDASQVSGIADELQKLIDDIDVDDVKGLDDHIEQVVEEKVNDAVEDAVSDAVRDIELQADSVEGLDDFVNEHVDVDSLQGLDQFVRGTVEEMSDYIGQLAVDAVTSALRRSSVSKKEAA